jgi:hypothetical protein
LNNGVGHISASFLSGIRNPKVLLLQHSHFPCMRMVGYAKNSEIYGILNLCFLLGTDRNVSEGKEKREKKATICKFSHIDHGSRGICCVCAIAGPATKGCG